VIFPSHYRRMRKWRKMYNHDYFFLNLLNSLFTVIYNHSTHVVRAAESVVKHKQTECREGSTSSWISRPLYLHSRGADFESRSEGKVYQSPQADFITVHWNRPRPTCPKFSYSLRQHILMPLDDNPCSRDGCV
jgi:hypothetical protein